MGHVPQRTCLACGRKTGKAELLRIARNKAGSFSLDPRQQLPGRGAYVCRSPACGELLKKKKGLHHGFRQPVPDAVYASVIEFLRAHASN
jgi:predicted RNA-binding protein YlxR (DUF448 family)